MLAQTAGDGTTAERYARAAVAQGQAIGAPLIASAPASNDPVTVGFMQRIGASDPLRTERTRRR